ncbi:MAG: CHAT domain-containing protein, partial [Prochlorotrichaceae cyanobacterium]
YGTISSSGTGIKITGYGTIYANATTYNHGVDIQGTVEATNTANVDITGFGGKGTDSNQGVSTYSTSNISAVDGDITIAGTANTATTGQNNSGISIGGTIATSDGAVSLTGTGGGGTDQNEGVKILVVDLGDGYTGDSISTVNGAITITGTASNGTTGQFNRGVSTLGTIASTGTSAVSLTGTGGAGTNNNDGAYIKGNISTNGQITIEGTGSSLTSGNANTGIRVLGTIASTAAGANVPSISLTGTGGSGTYGNTGIVINNSVTSVDSNINITGFGNTASSEGYNRGVYALGTIGSTQSGNITITGTGGSGTNRNVGVEINAFSNITSVLGTVTISGQGGSGTTDVNTGILSAGNITGGAVNLSGAGGVGTSSNHGVFALPNRSITATGNLSIIGIGGSGTNFNRGAYLESDLTTTNGNITITGTQGSGSDSEAIALRVNSVTLNGSGNLTLSGNTVHLSAGTIFTGNGGDLSIAPSTPSQALSLIFGDLVTDPFSSGGFNSITIGDLNSLGSVSITGTTGLNFADPLTIASKDPNTDFILNNYLRGTTNDASITIEGSGNTTTLNADITTTGTPIYINDSVILGADIKLDTTVGGGGGNITITGPITGSTQKLDIRSGTGSVNLPSSITIAGGNLTVDGLVTLNQNSIFSAGTGTIDFRRTLDTGGFDLTLRGNEIDFSNGAASVVGNLSGSTGGNLLLEPGQPDWNIDLAGVIINGSLNLTSTDLNALADGFNSITIGNNTSGNIRISGDVIFQDPTTLISGANIDTNPYSSINLQGTSNLTFSSLGSITFGSGFGYGAGVNIASADGTPLNTNLYSDSNGDGGAVTLYYSSLNTNGGNITISGGLDPITGYAQGVVGTPTGVTINTSALNAGTGQVTLRGQSQPVAGTLIHGVYLRNSSQVNGQNITITGTSSGTTDSDGVLVSGGSQIAALGDLTLTGTGTTGVKFLNSGVVQAANNASLIGTSTTGQSGILVDNSSIAVGGNLTLTADQVSLLGSGTSFTGAGGNLNVLAALDTNNLTLVFDGLGQPFATGGFSAVDFGRSTSQGTVNLSGTSSLTIADPFTLWSPQADLALNTALIGTDDASLTIQGSGNTTTLSANLITDSGEIYFNDSIILGTDVILDTTNTGSGANITITGTIDGTTPGAEQLTLNAGTSGTVQLGGAIGDTVPLAGFVVTGSGFSLGSNITTLNTSGTIVPTIGFNAPTTITAPITITAQQGRFVTNNALNLGSNDITFLVDGLRLLGGDSSVTGTGTLNLQPFSSNLTITLRALDNDSEVSLSGQSIAALADGFTQINLGDSLSGSNNFFIESGLVLRDPFVLQGQPAAKGGYLIGTGPGDVTFTLTGQNAGFLTGGLTFETNGSLSFLNATGIAAGAGTDTLVVNTGQNETIALADSTALPVLGSVAGLNFAGIEVLDLQGTADQLVGTAAADTIVINGPDAGLINGSLSFSGIESITTGDGDDTLRVVSGGSLSGLLDGGIGTDILDFSSQTGNLTVDIAQIGAISIETIVGNATTGITSTLKGLEAPGTPLTWILNSDQTGQVSGSGLAFTFGGFNALLGGSADDQFILGDGVNLAWAVDGGAGLDTLDYSAFTAPVAIDLQNSTATGLASISNLDNLIGGSTVQDVLTTLDTADTIVLSGTDTGTINSAITFNSFEVLNLGAGDDTFTLNGGTLSGTVGGVSIDGGFGIDTFTGDNVANTFAVTGTNSGSATGINGFSNIENLVGGTASDTVTITTGQSETLTLTGATTFNAVGINFSNMERVEAQGVNDLLLGTPGDDSVVINGLDEVLVSGVLQATGIENLNMAQGSDTLGLLVGADISGDWSGGDGIDRLDLSIQPGDVVVNLNQLASFGIETIIGKASSTGTDVSTIQGFDSPGSLVTWLINPDFSGQIFDTTTGTTYNFIGFNQFLGGSADDRFTLTEGLPLASLLDGGLGVDRLDYSGFSSPITVNLETNTATGLTGFQNIEGVTGSSSPDDVLVGLNSGNRFVLTAANQGTVNETFSFADFESLQGGTGDEIVSFQPGAQLSGNIEGGEGTLTLEGDRLDWNGFVSGTGQLNLQPLSSDRPIYLGENTGSSTTLELSAAALSSLQGFSGITVGLPQGNGLLSGTGALTVSSPLTLQSLGSGGAIDLSGATLTTPGTSVTLLANQSIQTNQITTNGGALTLISNEGSITSTGTLQTSGSEVGGDLTLIAPGAITTGDLNTSANTGGNLQVQSQSSITTGAITTRGLNGSGGNVLLDPPGDVQVTYIDARGTTQGGNVSITTGSLFRATGLIPDTLDSISTAGSLTGSATGGSITINHNGASLGEFFIVGLGTPNNGTVGGISSGNLRVPSGQYGQTFAITLDGSFNSLIGLDERPNINLIVEGTLIPTTLFEEEGGCPPDCTSDGTPPIDVNTIVPTITSVTELSIEEIETEFTDEVAEYNGVDRPQPRSLPQIQGDLKAVEDATGVKPAIIYVLFTPTTVNSEDEASSTPEKVIAKAAPVQPNPVPEVLWEFSDSASPLNLAQAQLPSGIDRQTLPSDELELILVTSQGIPTRIRVAGANRSRVEQAAALLRQEISDPGRTTSSRYLQPSRLLYNWIIRPLETNLEENEIDNLVFVMESGLRSMPVAALHDGEQFLIEKYSAGLMPSLSLTDTRYRDIRQVRLLGMGASQFEDQSDLPTVPLELSTIAGEIWGNGEYYLNEDFTIDNLRRRSENFGIIHLATHADFLPGSVDNSYIAFARERLGINGLREFGWQGTDPETDPAVELLTLSACKTAVGSEDAELGFAGLAVQAGVKSALASLWYVSDAATTGLMTKFYEILADPQAAPIKAEALRQAQLSFARGEISVEGTELRGLGVGGVRGSSIALPQDSVQLLNDRELSHPYYWASFTLVGSPW